MSKESVRYICSMCGISKTFSCPPELRQKKEIAERARKIAFAFLKETRCKRERGETERILEEVSNLKKDVEACRNYIDNEIKKAGWHVSYDTVICQHCLGQIERILIGEEPEGGMEFISRLVRSLTSYWLEMDLDEPAGRMRRRAARAMKTTKED